MPASSGSRDEYSACKLSRVVIHPFPISGNWYSVDGGPDLQISLARSSVYQNEDTSLYLTVTNIGRVTSFKAVAEPC